MPSVTLPPLHTWRKLNGFGKRRSCKKATSLTQINKSQRLTCHAVRQDVHIRWPHGSIFTSLSFSAQILHSWNVEPISQYNSYCSLEKDRQTLLVLQDDMQDLSQLQEIQRKTCRTKFQTQEQTAKETRNLQKLHWDFTCWIYPSSSEKSGLQVTPDFYLGFPRTVWELRAQGHSHGEEHRRMNILQNKERDRMG